MNSPITKGGRRQRRSPEHLLYCQTHLCEMVATKLFIVHRDAKAISLVLRCDQHAQETVKWYNEYLPDYSYTVKKLM